MAVQQNKKSPSKRGMHRAHDFLTAPALAVEPVSGEVHPDLILMDIVMPGVNGFQATRELANDPSTRTIPVIMVTSKAQESNPRPLGS